LCPWSAAFAEVVDRTQVREDRVPAAARAEAGRPHGVGVRVAGVDPGELLVDVAHLVVEDGLRVEVHEHVPPEGATVAQLADPRRVAGTKVGRAAVRDVVGRPVVVHGLEAERVAGVEQIV
jgi:hypothetical protein